MLWLNNGSKWARVFSLCLVLLMAVVVITAAVADDADAKKKKKGKKHRHHGGGGGGGGVYCAVADISYGQKDELLLFGDSITVGVGSVHAGGYGHMLAEDLNAQQHNYGICAAPASTISDKTASAKESLEKSRYVTYNAGTNDWRYGVTPERYEADVERGLDAILATCSDARDESTVYALGTVAWADYAKPGIDDYNERLKNAAYKRGFEYVDVDAAFRSSPGGTTPLLYDGLHWNDKGNRVAADAVLTAGSEKNC